MKAAREAEAAVEPRTSPRTPARGRTGQTRAEAEAETGTKEGCVRLHRG